MKLNDKRADDNGRWVDIVSKDEEKKAVFECDFC